MFGFDTAAITDGDEWLRTLDRFGILSDRAVLLDELTVAQNLAMTITLEIDPIPADVRGRVEALASEVGLGARPDRPEGGHADAGCQTARAPRAGSGARAGPAPPRTSRPPRWAAKMWTGFAADLRRLAAERALTMVAVTADAAFASAMTPDVLRLQPATGDLLPQTGTWARVKRLFGA